MNKPVSLHLMVVLLLAFIPSRSVCTPSFLPDTFQVRGANNEVLSNYYRYYLAPDARMSAVQAVRILKEGRFTAGNRGNDVLNTHYRGASCWLALGVRNDTSVSLDMLWGFYNNNLTYTLYDITDLTNPKRLDSVTHLTPIENRSSPCRAPGFRLKLDSGRYQRLLVRIGKLNTDAIYFPSDLSTTEDVLRYEVGYSFLMGLYTGGFLLAFIFNICMWLILRARIHLWHACYVLMVVFFSLSENMFDVLYLPAGIYQLFGTVPKTLWLALSLFWGMAVMQVFVTQRIRYPKLFRTFRCYQYLVVLFSTGLLIGSFLGYTQNRFMSLFRYGIICLIIAGYILFFLQIAWGIHRKDRLTLLYLIANTCFIIAAADYLKVDFWGKETLYQSYYFEPGNILIGLAFEIVVLTVIFIYKQQLAIRKSVEDLKEAEGIRSEAARNMLEVQQRVQRRIAQALHDSLGASLSSLRFFVANFYRGRKMVNEEERAFREAWDARIAALSDESRSIAHELMPAAFERAGLIAALRSWTATLNEEYDVHFEFWPDMEQSSLSIYQQLNLYRIVIELLQNVLRHAAASKASVNCREHDGIFRMDVTDNGIGFRTGGALNGLGLKGATATLEYYGGSLTINSNRTGSTISIQLPVS